MLRRKVRRGFFQERDVLGLLGHLRPQPHQLRALIGRKRLTATRIRPTTATGRGHPPPLFPHPLMQQILMKIQLTSNLGNTPIPVDHTMRRLNPVLRGKRTPRTRHRNILPGTVVPLSQMSTTSGEPQFSSRVRMVSISRPTRQVSVSLSSNSLAISVGILGMTDLSVGWFSSVTGPADAGGSAEACTVAPRTDVTGRCDRHR